MENTKTLLQDIQSLLATKNYSAVQYMLEDENQQRIQYLMQNLQEHERIELTHIKNQINQQIITNKPQYIEEVKQKHNKMCINNNYTEQQQIDFKKLLEQQCTTTDEINFNQFYGYPYYSIVKKVMIGYGDLFPLQNSIKLMHSQLRTLFMKVFNKQINYRLNNNRTSRNFNKQVKLYLSTIFKEDVQIFYRFHKTYHTIKKNLQNNNKNHTQYQNQHHSLDQKQIASEPVENIYLEIQKSNAEYFINLTVKMDKKTFNQYTRCRSINFLYFGTSKLSKFIDDGCNTLGNLSVTISRQIYELISFIMCRFIRRVIFTIIKVSNSTKLIVLQPHQHIEQNEIRIYGNELIDEYQGVITQYFTKYLTISQIAQQTFKNEYDQYGYKQLIPKQYLETAKKSNDSLSNIWSNFKEYRTLWVRRIQAEQYLRSKKGKKNQYVRYILQHLKEYQDNPSKLWKRYLLLEENRQKSTPTLNNIMQGYSSKKIKLDSFND